MAELTFKSAGVGHREIDLTVAAPSGPSGTPAGVIGPTMRGPAFVPVTVANLGDFVSKFGEPDGKWFGPLAAAEWLRNAQSLTYVRPLGVGDGLKRATTGDTAGRVNRAGFVVGQTLPQESGLIAANPKANAGGPLGRMYFLGSLMSASNGSAIFSDPGIQQGRQAHPIIRGVVMVPSGVTLMLSGNFAGNNTPPTSTTVATSAGPRGALTGTVNLSDSSFVIYLNGHKGSTRYPIVLTASFDVTRPNYFPNVLNTDPTKIEDAGHYLYANYDIHPNLAVLTGTLIYSTSASFGASGLMDVAYVTTGALVRNSGSAFHVNYENFEDRFQTPSTPFVISQRFGGNPVDLFKVHAVSDGAYATDKYKISIQNIVKSQTDLDKYGRFDLLVREITDSDDDPVVLERFPGLTLNPGSDRYIARVIGDQRIYFDFDKTEDGQKLVVEGNFPNKSDRIRVEMSDAVENGLAPAESLPVGFRGPYHLVTSGSFMLTAVEDTSPTQAVFPKRSIEPPIPYRQVLTLGVDPKLTVNSNLYWGVRFELQDSITEPNSGKSFNSTILSFAKYFPRFMSSVLNFSVGDNAGTADLTGGVVLDSDRFNYNLFSLEHVQVRTGSDGVADPKEWASASYVRRGGIVANDTNKTRGLSVTTDFGDSTVQKMAKFSFFLQGGFDGVNIFRQNLAELQNSAVKQEIDDTNQGQTQGATFKAYEKALKVIGEKSDVDIKLLAVPGIRVKELTDRAITTVETRFDALYIMDIEERDSLDSAITSSLQELSVTNTVSAFDGRALDTSFAAAYFPDVTISDPLKDVLVKSPPSVAVLGAFSYNDRVAHPWFAPAGFTRGALSTVENIPLAMGQSALDILYNARINPLVKFPDQADVVVWGQKTLQAVESALDRVNVRRLLIEVRRQVREVANSFIFEPNRASTLAKFSAKVNPRLQRIQEQSGIDRFKVIIDTTTTTQADVENNTIRGKIFIQPTKTAEFISLDFVVTNAGANI